MLSDSGDDSDETNAVSEQLSGSFINDGDYTQSPGHEQDGTGNGETQQVLHYAVDNALQQEDSPGLCRLVRHSVVSLRTSLYLLDLLK